MYHSLAYQYSFGAGPNTDVDMSAVTDSEVSQRNNHYILTEQYQLLAAMAFGATLTRENIQIPTWNAVGRMNISPVNRSSTTVPSPPQWDLWVQYPPPLPENEELTVKATNTAAGAELGLTILQIGTTDWSQNLPRGIADVPIIEVRCTAAVTLVSQAYSALVPITVEQSLRGGVYAVVGAQWQCTNGVMIRMVFPRQKMYQGRKLRPGVVCQNAIGDQQQVLPPYNPFFWGVHGWFSTFEPPQIEALAFTAGAQTAEGRLWLVRVSADMRTPV